MYRRRISWFSRSRKGAFNRGPKSSERSPLGGPNEPQARPRRPQERPGRSTERAKSHQERPKRTQEPPKFRFRAALAAKWDPPGAQELSGGLQEAILDPPWGDFDSPGNNIHTLLHLPDSICQTVLYATAKLMQAYGQHRSTSLSNFDVLVQLLHVD